MAAAMLAPSSPTKLFRRASTQLLDLEASVLCRRSHWVPASSRRTCANCHRSFKLFAGKHHCRLCGEVVCKACSSKRVLFQGKSVRACDDCIDAKMQSLEASASASFSAVSRRQSLPDARFQGRASSRSLLSTSRHSLPYAPSALASSGSESDEQVSSTRSRPRRLSKESAATSRSVVTWSGVPGQLSSVVFVLCLAVLASLLSAAARR